MRGARRRRRMKKGVDFKGEVMPVPL